MTYKNIYKRKDRHIPPYKTAAGMLVKQMHYSYTKQRHTSPNTLTKDPQIDGGRSFSISSCLDSDQQGISVGSNKTSSPGFTIQRPKLTRTRSQESAVSLRLSEPLFQPVYRQVLRACVTNIVQFLQLSEFESGGMQREGRRFDISGSGRAFVNVTVVYLDISVPWLLLF